MSREAYQLQGGNGGFTLEDGEQWPATGLASGAGAAVVQVVTDTVFDSFESKLDGSSKLCGPTIPAGTLLGGQPTYINVTTGLVNIYL